MVRHMMGMLGAIASVALIVAAMWTWHHAGQVWPNATRPEVAEWAIRSAAIGAGALAQVLLLVGVVGNTFRRDLFDRVLRGLAGLTCAVCLVSAAALALAAR